MPDTSIVTGMLSMFSSSDSSPYIVIEYDDVLLIRIEAIALPVTRSPVVWTVSGTVFE